MLNPRKPTERESKDSGPPRPSSQHKRDLFAPEGQRSELRDKDRDRGQGEEKRTRKKGKGNLSWRDKGLPLHREEKDGSTGKWLFIKVKEKPCVRMKCLILIGHIN